jgi:O-antigen/teichoic acid export membrane protein
MTGLISGIVNAVILVVVFFASDHISLDLSLAISLAVMSLLISVILGSFLLMQKIPRGSQPTLIVAKDLWQIGWPQMISRFSLYNLSQAAILLLGIIASPSDVAIYVTAMKLIIILRLPLFVINAVFSPIIAELNEKGDMERLERILTSVTTVSILCSSLVVVIFFWMGEDILSLIYGEVFSKGYYVLCVLAIGQLFNVGAGPCARLLSLTGRQKILMKVSVFTVLISTALGSVLALKYSTLGMALGFSIGVVMQSLIVQYVTKKYVGISPSADISLRGVQRMWQHVISRGGGV